MAKDQTSIRQRFADYIRRKWIQNDHNLKEIPCVYALVSFDVYNTNVIEVAYIGSSIKLNSRYKSHKVPNKIQKEGKISIMYFLPMSKGFYDYEIKLINKLKPQFNKQHKNG